jgi:hypothetical protein
LLGAQASRLLPERARCPRSSLHLAGFATTVYDFSHLVKGAEFPALCPCLKRYRRNLQDTLRLFMMIKDRLIGLVHFLDNLRLKIFLAALAIHAYWHVPYHE